MERGGEQATTASQYITKAGECPAVDDDTAGICVEECRADGDCDGAEKCCSNGCGKTCMRPTGYDVCSLLKDPGSCGNWTVRWYYNREEAQCDRFWFSQCGGNDNRFMTEAECLNRCVGTPVTTLGHQPPRTPQPRPSDCRLSVFNCCEDGYTSKLDAEGTNCQLCAM
ncbi:eppin-like [Dreissena polymorpha]|uniref:eppin-like n=1 Tax=Dreissena polymorpha TaxID=45954 RepID=UPI0022646B35|nr:eppin-like [Dreissena polymorpha]